MSGMAFVDYVRRAVGGQSLEQDEACAAIASIMAGTATPAQIAALLVGLSLKGETADEIAGAARAMREASLRIETQRRPLLDVCGTGGDGTGTFNVSTAVAFVVAGAGVAVAKHGNRAASSRCGSADVLEALGVKIDAPPEVSRAALEEVGIAFLFAQTHHPAMKHVAPVRREIGVRTLFNLLGPLTNPAGATHQVVGVAQERSLRLVAEALGKLGAVRAVAIRGEDGIDEASISAPTRVVEWTGDDVIEYTICPADVGLTTSSRESIAGGDAAENAAIVRDVLAGRHGPHRDVVLLNAALALRVAGVAADIADGARRAARAIDDGAAREKLEGLRRATA